MRPAKNLKKTQFHVSNAMKNYLLINVMVTGTVSLFLLFGGCASQPKTSKAPAPLEREIKSIEGAGPRAASPQAVFGEKTTYIVKKGDTLWRISKNYGVSVDAILGANRSVDIKDLKVGQKLIIPASEKSYTLRTASSGYVQKSSIPGGVSSRGFMWPVKGQIVSQFGEMRNGVKNSGIDILLQPGQSIVAAKKGTIEAVSDGGDGMSVIVIKHEGGIRTMCEYPGNPVVGEGSYVEIGQPVATINSTNTGNPQEVNFKIYVKDKPVNPMTYLP